MTTPIPDRWSAAEFERIAREITHGWMAHLGYTPEQIDEYEMNNQHERAGRDFDSANGWFCMDEDGKSLHPQYDELDFCAELVMFVLEHPALARVLTAPDIEPNRQYGRRMGNGLILPSSLPDPTHYRLIGPWREVTDGD